jgi:hypothetical protein
LCYSAKIQHFRIIICEAITVKKRQICISYRPTFVTHECSAVLEILILNFKLSYMCNVKSDLVQEKNINPSKPEIRRNNICKSSSYITGNSGHPRDKDRSVNAVLGK